MKESDLLVRFLRWIEASFHPLDTLDNLHCSRVWKSVPGPSLGDVTAVSVRHQIPLVSRAPELFVVELWDLLPRVVEDADVARMCARLASYRAWYDELLEDAEVEGRRRRHRFSVHGNLVGASVAATPLVDLLSLHGREVAFWTYRVSEGGAEFEPHVREEQPVAASPLPGMLDHLPWEPPPRQIRVPEDTDRSFPFLPTTR